MDMDMDRCYFLRRGASLNIHTNLIREANAEPGEMAKGNM